MPERIPVFEPEVEELLLEVASNPDSLLLRGPQLPGPIGPLDLEQGVSARMAGLTIPERHLLRVWRAEAAELLRQAFNWSLGAVELQSRTRVGQLDFKNNERRICDAASIEDTARHLERIARARYEKDSLVEALSKFRDGAASSPNLSRHLILLSYRMRPTDSARIGMALMEAEAERHEQALAMYRSIFNRTSSREMQAYALYNAIRHIAETDTEQAQLDIAEELVSLAPNWAYSRLKHLTTHLQLGTSGEALLSFERLLDLGPATETLLEDHLEWYLGSSDEGHFSCSRHLRGVGRALVERSSGRTRELLADLAR